jgi:hypothetical protein
MKNMKFVLLATIDLNQEETKFKFSFLVFGLWLARRSACAKNGTIQFTDAQTAKRFWEFGKEPIESFIFVFENFRSHYSVFKISTNVIRYSRLNLK